MALSGGQKQRVAIATALVSERKILVLISSSLLSHIKNLSYHQKLKHIFLSKDISSKDRKDQGYDHKDQKSMC